MAGSDVLARAMPLAATASGVEIVRTLSVAGLAGRFALELAAFVVTVAAVLALVSPTLGLSGRPARRAVIGLGLGLVAGSEVVAALGRVAPAVLGGALGLAGALVAGLGAGLGAGLSSPTWSARARLERRAWWVGLAGVVGSAISGLAGADQWVGMASTGVLAVAWAVGLVGLGRSAISTRIAVAAAAGLLVVVVLLASVLDSVATRSLVRQATRRVVATSDAAAMGLEQLAEGQVAADAELAAALVESHLARVCPALPPPRACISRAAAEVRPALPRGAGLAFTVAGVDGVPTTTAGGRSGVLRGAVLEARGDQVDATAWYPDVRVVDGVRRVVGVARVTLPVDPARLRALGRGDPGLTLALVGSSGRGIAAGPLARRVRESLVAGRPGLGPAVAIVVRVPLGDDGVGLVGAIGRTRLEQSAAAMVEALFAVALGASVVALVIADWAGERLGRRLRQLTEAARALQAGDGTVRAALPPSNDEVGRLGAAFDQMAAAIETTTGALRATVAHESVLGAHLRAVLEGIAEAVVAVDPSGCVTDVNSAAERLLGRRREELLGRPALEAVDVVEGVAPAPEGPGPEGPGPEGGAPEGGAVVQSGGRSLFDRLRPGVTGVGELRAVAGLPVPVAVSVGEIGLPTGTAGGRVLVLRDLRAEREAERVQAAFLARVGHELRTPLTGIIGYAGLLSGGRPVSPRQAEQWHREILGQAERLLRTVELLEFFAGGGVSRPAVRLEPFDLGRFLHDRAERWQSRIDASHRLRLEDRSGGRVVTGDLRWLGVALDELVDNAIKFSPGGGVVTVGAEVGEETVTLSVSDTGKGMTPREAEAAFELFVQGESGDTRPFGGLGLGLAVVRQVAVAHGGRATVSPLPEGGARVTLEWPRRDGPGRERTVPPGPPVAS